MLGSQLFWVILLLFLSWHFCSFLFLLLSLVICCLELDIPCAFWPYYLHLLLCTLGVLPCYYTLLFHLTISPCLLFHALILLDCYFFPFTPSKNNLCKSWNGELHIFLSKLDKFFTFHFVFLKNIFACEAFSFCVYVLFTFFALLVFFYNKRVSQRHLYVLFQVRLYLHTHGHKWIILMSLNSYGGLNYHTLKYLTFFIH